MIDLSLILFNTSWGLYSIPKESKCTAALLSVNNEAQCVTLLYLSSRYIVYPLSLILCKLSIEKTSLNLAL